MQTAKFELNGGTYVMPFNQSVERAISRGSKQSIKNQLLCQIGEFVTQIGAPSLGFRTIIELNDRTVDLSSLPPHMQRMVRPKGNHEDGDFLLERDDHW